MSSTRRSRKLKLTLKSPHFPKAKLGRVKRLCLKYRVTRLELFGSACTDRFDRRRSDFDFIVEFEKRASFGPWCQRFFEFKDELTAALGRYADLIVPVAFQSSFFQLVPAKPVKILTCLRLLAEAHDNCVLIRSAVRGRSASAFAADWILRAAIERKIGLIGEALKKVAELDPHLAQRVHGYQMIVRFRHIVGDIDASRLWKVTTKDIPLLLRNLSAISKTYN